MISLLMQTRRYKAGPLLKLCLGFINKDHPSYLAPTRGFPDRERLKLQRFISGMRIITTSAGPNGSVETARVIKKLSGAGADRLTFQQNGHSVTVADYYRLTRNRPLQFPDVLCVEVSLCLTIILQCQHTWTGRKWGHDSSRTLQSPTWADNEEAGSS
jgi:hypothetical protein